LDFLKYIVKCCQGCVFIDHIFSVIYDLWHIQTIAPKQCITHGNIFLTVLVFLLYYSLKILPTKPLGCCTNHAHLSTDMIRISCEPDKPTWVFFSCEKAVNTASKAWFNTHTFWKTISRNQVRAWFNNYHDLEVSIGYRRSSSTNIHTYQRKYSTTTFWSNMLILQVNVKGMLSLNVKP